MSDKTEECLAEMVEAMGRLFAAHDGGWIIEADKDKCRKALASAKDRLASLASWREKAEHDAQLDKAEAAEQRGPSNPYDEDE